MARFFEYEYKPGEELVLRFRRPAILPREVRQHFLGAQKELLLALRSLVDALVKEIEGRMEGPPEQRRTEIKVE